MELLAGVLEDKLSDGFVILGLSIGSKVMDNELLAEIFWSFFIEIDKESSIEDNGSGSQSSIGSGFIVGSICSVSVSRFVCESSSSLSHGSILTIDKSTGITVFEFNVGSTLQVELNWCVLFVTVLYSLFSLLVVAFDSSVKHWNIVNKWIKKIYNYYFF